MLEYSRRCLRAGRWLQEAFRLGKSCLDSRVSIQYPADKVVSDIDTQHTLMSKMRGFDPVDIGGSPANFAQVWEAQPRPAIILGDRST